MILTKGRTRQWEVRLASSTIKGALDYVILTERAPVPVLNQLSGANETYGFPYSALSLKGGGAGPTRSEYVN